MTTELHHANSRGCAEHGWLSSRHSFSFADYYNPKRMGFGLLKVINDDVVQPGKGFAVHPHRNMEIISIPLSGALRHRDNMGNHHIIRAGEIQVMSAGTGITHSEYNHSDSEAVNFLQIWVLPDKQNITPGYQQKMFPAEERKNQFQLLISPEPDSESLLINQQAYFSMLDLEESKSVSYQSHSDKNGVYLFIISGKVQVLDNVLTDKDALAITDERAIAISASSNSQILCIEVPML
ncbi:MAG: pirin family protein [Gammaproteobacteria bacterium]|nr:pirin family protein [Gammaproteobacteria bacterium]